MGVQSKITKKNSRLRREWEFKPSATSPFGFWELSYQTQSEIEILKRICIELKDFMKPLSFRIRIRVGSSRKEAKAKNGGFSEYNNSLGFSYRDIEKLFYETMSLVQAPENNKFPNFYLTWQTYLTLYKDEKLISEWFPSSSELSNILNQYPDTSLNGIINSSIFNDLMQIETNANIWVPESHDDELASINGKRLKNMLTMIERITGGKIDQWEEDSYGRIPPGRDRMIEKYGFIDPKELPLDFRKIVRD